MLDYAMFFPSSNSFRVFSHRRGFGAELLSDSLWFSGAGPSWASRFHAKFHQGSTKVSFLAIVKALGQNDTFVFWGSLQQMAVASQKVL